ncbi:hypothetical protein EIN_052390 [Entamoeba invadens IP1]|uniref:hypothetical protein n=1 Tax=Entamoeba invadens IP1 TaxID=370355 RepID=UPI0002C3DCEC|nr:hypothetical protein EIN_052390 [Entamoeba invadens IP1]ELP93034.1 hypothetical protein EIN_052390 [Entamoeba invadens IP1]|eukprot:XP_004259805.1 hypothetical protein EIN_052390 [Entamoeba invadens IP1]
MKKIGVINNLSTVSAVFNQYNTEFFYDNPYPPEFVASIPKHEEITEEKEKSFDVVSLYHKITGTNENFFTYQFSFNPELEQYIQMREILANYFKGEMFYIHKDFIFFNHQIDEEIEVDFGDIPITVTFTQTEASLDQFRATDIIRSSLYKTQDYTYQKRHICCMETIKHDDNEVHQTFDVCVNSVNKNLYVHFPVTDREIDPTNYWDKSKTMTSLEIEAGFRPGWYYNRISKGLEWIDDILLTRTAETQKFFWKDKEVTVEEYYLSRYEGAVHFEKGQFLFVQKQRKYGRVELSYYVPELMHEVRRVKQIHPLQETLLVISKALETLNVSPIAEAWGVRVDSELMKCTAQMCNVPLLVTNLNEFSADEQWRFPNSFVQMVPLRNWIFYTKAENSMKVKRVANLLYKMVRSFGVECEEPKIVIQSSRDTSEKRTFENIKATHPQIVLTSLDSHEHVRTFKDYFTFFTDIPTQVIDVCKSTTDVISRVATHVCMKVGNVRYYLKDNEEKTCIIGIESKELMSNKTLVTVSLSTEETLTQYKTHFTLVDGHKWYMGCGFEGLENDLKGRDLKQIVVYREGISENMMKYIRKYEVEELVKVAKRACGDDVKICYMSTDNISSALAVYNNGELVEAKEGAYVVNTLVNENVKGFILNTHPGLCKTMKCTVLFDEINWKLEKLIQFTFNICHLCQFKNKTMKLPSCLMEARKQRRNIFVNKYIEELLLN